MNLPSTDTCRHGDGSLTCNPTLHDTCRACFEPIKEIHNGVSRVWLHVPQAGAGSGTDICTRTTTATPGGRLVIESAQARDAYMDALDDEGAGGAS